MPESWARAKLLEQVTGLPPCLIDMEDGSGAHHWALQSAPSGTVRLMAPKLVTPHRQSGRSAKNDATDPPRPRGDDAPEHADDD